MSHTTTMVPYSWATEFTFTREFLLELMTIVILYCSRFDDVKSRKVNVCHICTGDSDYSADVSSKLSIAQLEAKEDPRQLMTTETSTPAFVSITIPVERKL